LAFCRKGVGTLLAKLAEGLPIQLSTPVTTVDWGGRWIEVQFPRGDLRARAVIITASTRVLAAGKIRFDPELPKRHLEAIGNLGLGSYDHGGDRIRLQSAGADGDDLVFEKATSQRTAALPGAGLAEEGETAWSRLRSTGLPAYTAPPMVRRRSRARAFVGDGRRRLGGGRARRRGGAQKTRARVMPRF
jgi:hypothetical protein